MRATASLVFALSGSIAVLAAIVVAITVIGPPWEARAHRLDEQRVQDLQAIAAGIERHRRTYGSLPATLAELRQPMAVLPLADAASGQPYEYRAKDESSYELCARFETSSEPNRRIPPFWNHDPGRHCFALTAPLPIPR